MIRSDSKRHAQRVGVCAVVSEDRFVVVVDEEMPGPGSHQRRGRLTRWQRPIPQPAKAALLPLAERSLHGHHAFRATAFLPLRDGLDRRARRFRHDDFAPPGHLVRPAVLPQVEGDRCKHVGLRRPDVAAAVAVEVLRVLQVGGRHELGLPERARPRSLELCQIDVTAIENLERAEQLRSEERGAARIVRERRERRDGRPNTGEAPEVRLEAPHRDHDARRHAVALSDVGEQRPVLGEHRLARANQGRREPPLQVLIELECEFGLRAVAFEDRVVRVFDVRKGGLENLRADSPGRRFGPELGEPLGERLRRRERRDRRNVLRASDEHQCHAYRRRGHRPPAHDGL